MKHLMICREYPPAPGGGIGVYCARMSRLLAERGETVHVISQLWDGAEKKIEKQCNERLIVHRLPYDDWTSLRPGRRHPALKSAIERNLFDSTFPPQYFAWAVALFAEKLIESEGIEVIEGSDYEAPLYYLQLRRALGMGPANKPPCFVHLHSPTEFIAQHNNWDSRQPSVVAAKQLEEFSIRMADGLLCPSRYLTDQVETHYGLQKGSVKTVPYPIGECKLLTRDKETWKSGLITYVGRLEGRKGVVEFVDAAISIARLHPEAHFAFIGADTFDATNRSVRQRLEKSIPRGLKNRFRFYGKLGQKSVFQLLGKSRLAVVPSRWENFPNTCIEAMASGLPVVASCEGGMAEIITDRKTGWLVPNLDSESLKTVLERALATAPSTLATMGRYAASAVSQHCDNDRTVEKQLGFRRRLINMPTHRSTALSNSVATSITADSSRGSFVTNDAASGIVIVLTCAETNQVPLECLESIEAQTVQPRGVLIATSESGGELRRKIERRLKPGWQVVSLSSNQLSKFSLANRVLNSKLNPLAISFIKPIDVLASSFIADCQETLTHCPDVGIVSGWTANQKGFDIEPCPNFPYQWQSNGAASFSAIRTAALRSASAARLAMKPPYEAWYLFSAMMAAGWVAVTLPKVLVRKALKIKHSKSKTGFTQADLEEMRAVLLENFPQLSNTLNGFSNLSEPLSQRKNYLADQISRAAVLARYPRTTGPQLYGRLKSKVLRGVRHSG
jgi:glycosyltransferase involved in cell wall biosynthesis